MKHLAVIFCLAIASAEVMAANPSVETVKYNCGGWINKKGEHLLGRQVAIVMHTDLVTGAKDLLVRTGPVIPNPKYDYELLTLKVSGADTSEYLSDSYDVNFFLMPRTAAIRALDGSVNASCTAAP